MQSAATAMGRRRPAARPVSVTQRPFAPGRVGLIPTLIRQARGAKGLPPLKSVTALLAKKGKKKKARLASRTKRAR